ncbi:MAG: hypothetical protein SV686_16650, partial [Thermodesulfobacteriota bacterium]|nr:hypothetical protein [Thermodesulfobacteriota bacterium]
PVNHPFRAARLTLSLIGPLSLSIPYDREIRHLPSTKAAGWRISPYNASLFSFCLITVMPGLKWRRLHLFCAFQ